MSQQITYCILTLNRLSELQTAIRRVAWHVDRTIVIDGYSTDGTVEWLQSQECKDFRVKHRCIKQHLYQYGNHNPDKRNPYLDMAGYDGWILVTDTDEFLEPTACWNLRNIVQEAEELGFDGVRFNPHDIWYYADGTLMRDQIHKDYWTPMLFKSYPGQRYEGHTHVTLVRPGAKNNFWDIPYTYQHVKDERRLWRNSTQNYWTTVGLATNNTDDETWQNFHKLMQKYGYLDWHEFDRVMTTGEVPQEIVTWFIDHRDASNPEERSWFVHYLVLLHPNLNINKLSNKDKSV